VNWVRTPLSHRRAFQIRTKDRRIQGAAADAADGKYVGYTRDSNIFQDARGTYHQSHYFYRRSARGRAGRTARSRR
jgi:hypothetical protein